MSYSRLKKFKCFLKVFLSLLEVNLQRKRVPFMLEFQITRACNLKCKYCYADLESLHGEDFSFTQIKEIIDEFYRLGTRVVRLLGGEPLLHPGIGEIIHYLRQKDIFIELATNGMFIERWIEDLKNVDILQISIDGNEQAHDAARGEGTYQRVLRGLKLAVKAKLPVRLHSVFNKISVQASPESPVTTLAKLSKKYNVPFNFCQYVLGEQEKRCGVLNKAAYISFADTQKYYHELLQYKKKGYIFFNSYEAMKQIMHWPDATKDVLYQEEVHKLPFYFSKCRAGELYCFLDSDGSLYPCVPLWKKGLNIKEVGIKRAWEAVQEIRQKEDCFSCVSLGDMEFSKTLALKLNALFNTFTKVFSL